MVLSSVSLVLQPFGASCGSLGPGPLGFRENGSKFKAKGTVDFDVLFLFCSSYPIKFRGFDLYCGAPKGHFVWERCDLSKQRKISMNSVGRKQARKQWQVENDENDGKMYCTEEYTTPHLIMSYGCITLHRITLHDMTLGYVTLHHITLHSITLQYSTSTIAHVHS